MRRWWCANNSENCLAVGGTELSETVGVAVIKYAQSSTVILLSDINYHALRTNWNANGLEWVKGGRGDSGKGDRYAARGRRTGSRCAVSRSADDTTPINGTTFEDLT